MSKSEHTAKARAFLDSILQINKQHGVVEQPAIKYAAAVKAAAKTPKRLQKNRTTPNRLQESGSAPTSGSA